MASSMHATLPNAPNPTIITPAPSVVYSPFLFFQTCQLITYPATVTISSSHYSTRLPTKFQIAANGPLSLHDKSLLPVNLQMTPSLSLSPRGERTARDLLHGHVFSAAGWRFAVSAASFEVIFWSRFEWDHGCELYDTVIVPFSRCRFGVS